MSRAKSSTQQFVSAYVSGHGNGNGNGNGNGHAPSMEHPLFNVQCCGDCPLRQVEAATPTLAVADHGLTSRELDIILHVAEGKKNREIAGTLFLSEQTIKTHLTGIIRKLPVSNRTGIAVWAIRNGLI